jgi:hypothetical protein
LHVCTSGGAAARSRDGFRTSVATARGRERHWAGSTSALAAQSPSFSRLLVSAPFQRLPSLAAQQPIATSSGLLSGRSRPSSLRLHQVSESRCWREAAAATSRAGGRGRR